MNQGQPQRYSGYCNSLSDAIRRVFRLSRCKLALAGVHYVRIGARFVLQRTMRRYSKEVEDIMGTPGEGYQSVSRHYVTTLEGDWHPSKGVVLLEFLHYTQAWA
jgi:hypothetical protein